MNRPLHITTVTLTAGDTLPRIFEMTRRCAFAVCTRGKFVIKVLNEVYTVRRCCSFACMPFVNIEIVEVSEDAEVIFGYIRLEDVPKLITSWVNTENLVTIQHRPVVQMHEGVFDAILTSIREYETECSYIDRAGASTPATTNAVYRLLEHDIIECRCRLIIAQVLRFYYTRIRIDSREYTHRDYVFQSFMLSLYSNFRKHRHVYYYAQRSGLSLKYFSTVVKQISGASPSEWIERVVVGEAKSMLLEPHRTIKGIASSLNFPDTPTFTKYFQRVTGMTPKTYRQTNLSQRSE